MDKVRNHKHLFRDTKCDIQIIRDYEEKSVNNNLL